MRIIKLGGSLTQAKTLLKCLDTIDKNYDTQKTVIVPGGGAFADQVRTEQSHWLFDDSTASLQPSADETRESPDATATGTLFEIHVTPAFVEV